MKIKELFSDIKTWLLLIVFFIGIGTAFAGVIKLPKKIEVVEKKIEATEDNVQKLAGDIGTYIAKQEVLRDEQDKREKLLIELIKEIKK